MLAQRSGAAQPRCGTPDHPGTYDDSPHSTVDARADQVLDRLACFGEGLHRDHYFDSKQALIRAVITRQAESASADGEPQLGALDSFDALRAWADAAIENQTADDGRGGCTLSSLAGELSGSDESSRAELNTGFLRWKALLEQSLASMQDRGELRADADLATLAYVLLAALQGGTLLSQTMRTIGPMRAAMDSAITYVRSFCNT